MQRQQHFRRKQLRQYSSRRRVCLRRRATPTAPLQCSSATHSHIGYVDEKGARWLRGVVSYDGASFNGFQLQRSAAKGITKRTVQSELERVLLLLASGSTREELSLCAASRTDAGVHATCNVIRFRLPPTTNTAREASEALLRQCMNRLLASDIRVLALESSPRSFHPAICVSSKTYHYLVHIAEEVDPYYRDYRHSVRPIRPSASEQMQKQRDSTDDDDDDDDDEEEEDSEDHQKDHVDDGDNSGCFDEVMPHFDAMCKAASCFVGEHDFSSFTNKADEQRRQGRSLVRVVRRCDVVRTEYGLRIEVEAKGFLYRMVRNIAGTLLAIGMGVLDDDDGNAVPTLMDACDRTAAPAAAPARGLHLVDVSYVTDFEFATREKARSARTVPG